MYFCGQTAVRVNHIFGPVFGPAYENLLLMRGSRGGTGIKIPPPEKLQKYRVS